MRARARVSISVSAPPPHICMDACKYFMYVCALGIARWETKGSSVNRKCQVTGDMLQSGLKDKPYGCGGGMGGSKHVSSGGRGERPGGHVDWKMDFKDLDDFGKALCQANRDNGSWRQKLE